MQGGVFPKHPHAALAAPAGGSAALPRRHKPRASRSETLGELPWPPSPADSRPPRRPLANLRPSPPSPLLQLHIDDKQNTSGSLKISTDHGNARYSISVRSRRPPPRDCWWGHPSLPHVCNTLRLKPTPSWPLPLRQPAHRPAHCAATFKVQTAPDPALSLAPPLRNSGL